MAQTPHMALELLEQAQAQKEVTVNEALFRIDAVLNSGAIDRGLNTPPVSPLEGDVYIIGAAPEGLWAGKANHVAYFHQIWRFITPNAGMLLWVMDELIHVVFSGTAWIDASVSGGGGGGGSGSGDMIKATYDAANINQQLVGVSASQILTNKTINASNNTFSNISLSTAVTGTLPIANGGTGITAVGASGNVLTSNGTTWVSSAPAIIQRIYTSTATMSTSTSQIPLDDTIPQNTEGFQVFSQAITPTNAANKLRIECEIFVSNSVSDMCAVALFQDSAANALAVAGTGTSGATMPALRLVYEVAAGSTVARDYKIRAGVVSRSGGTMTINGIGGVRQFGGVLISSMTITEYKA